MDFLNRFVAEEMPTMRTLLWRLSEPSTVLHRSDRAENGIDNPLHVAQLVDVLTVLKQHSTSEAIDAATCISPSPTTSSTFCSQCVSLFSHSFIHCLFV